MVCICTSLGLHAAVSVSERDRFRLHVDALPRDPQGPSTGFHALLRAIASRPDRCQRPHVGDDLADVGAVPGPGRFQEYRLARPVGRRDHRPGDAVPVAGVGHGHSEPVVYARRRHDPRGEPAFARLRQALPRRHAGRGEAAGPQAPRGSKHPGLGARRGPRVHAARRRCRPRETRRISHFRSRS